MGLQWYAVFSKPRKEAQVAAYFHTQDIEVYFPTIRVKPVNPRSSTIRPFFPRYLFVRADMETTGLNSLHYVPGAVGLVVMGGVPVTVEDEYIQELQTRVKHFKLATAAPLVPFTPGETVRIVQGPFAGFEAIFDQRLNDEQRVQLLLKWLGQERKVRVDAQAIRKQR